MAYSLWHDHAQVANALLPTLVNVALADRQGLSPAVLLAPPMKCNISTLGSLKPPFSAPKFHFLPPAIIVWSEKMGPFPPCQSAFKQICSLLPHLKPGRPMRNFLEGVGPVTCASNVSKNKSRVNFVLFAKIPM